MKFPALLRRPALGVALLALAALGLGYGLGQRAGARSAARSTAPRAAERPSLPAPPQRARVERAAFPIEHAAAGSLRSRSEVALAARVGGRVIELGVDVGERVSAGQVLVRLEADELAARQAQAESQRRAAEVSLKEALQHFERVEALVQRGAATAEELEQAHAARARAEASLGAARQALVEARVLREQAELRAPFEGVVAARHVDPGDLAWAGRTLLEIFDPAALRLEAAVPEGWIAHLPLGAPVAIELGSPARRLAGRVGEIAPGADPRTRTFLVRVPLDDAAGLQPGQFARLVFDGGTREAVRVPEAAVSRVGQLAQVLVEREGRWTRRHVTLGRAGEGWIEVLSGLAGGETIGWGAPETR